MTDIALVLGASGGFGGAVAAELEQRGWQVRRWRRGTDMAQAAKGARLIVNGLNPPNYHNWAELIPAITTEVLAAAKASGATVLVPGNVYPLGCEPAPWGLATPQRPVSRKGEVRAEMEARYRRAAKAGAARVILLRAGDFLGESQKLAINSVMLKDIAKGKVTALGPADVCRAYAYLPDLARAAVALAERRDLPPYLEVPFAGHSFSMVELAAIISDQLGRDVTVSRFPNWVFGWLSPFWELARELREMLYLYTHPHWIQDNTLRDWLPEFRATPLEEVVARLLAAKGLRSRSEPRSDGAAPSLEPAPFRQP